LLLLARSAGYDEYAPATDSILTYIGRLPAEDLRHKLFNRAVVKLRALDLTSAVVRKAVSEAQDAKALYEGQFAVDY
jgi:hypothetical protein